MATERHDPVTGRTTTGHEWNGIEELNTPVPRVVLFFLAAGIVFSLVYWVLMPAWPLGWTYTRGLLGFDQREVVTRQVEEAAAARAVWTERIADADFAEIAADDGLMAHVRETGRTLFLDNCAGCHGADGTGNPGYPDLTAGAWLWGGDPETVFETIRVGINSTHAETRLAQMLAFGRDGMLGRDEVLDVTAFVRALSRQALDDAERARLGAGRDIYAVNCAGCHGEDGRGIADFGAPDLTDDVWIYGGDAASIRASIHAGREGHMPHWEGRLSPVDIRLLTLYVGALGEAR